ncbi:kelch-like protein [Acrasis kona]|uniref:Kelch-like protein n=1 Tax=Acrasis kona TaxID=1008807 RepID=A0AAW2Z8L1_9EUKA
MSTQNVDDSQDYQSIDTTGTAISTVEGRAQITLDKKVTNKAFKEVLEYLYTDKVSWDKDTDKDLIKETQEAAKYLGINRLDIIAETFLDKTKNVAVPESTWWKNMRWAFENLRRGQYSMSDLTLICRGDGSDVEVPCHAVILTSACKYFHGMLLGDVDNEEKKTMKIVIEDATEKQMEAILKYVYTREFDVEVNDVVGVWILANKFLLEDLQVECESMIMKNINTDNVVDIKKIAEMVNSKRIIELCEDILKDGKK